MFFLYVLYILRMQKGFICKIKWDTKTELKLLRMQTTQLWMRAVRLCGHFSACVLVCFCALYWSVHCRMQRWTTGNSHLCSHRCRKLPMVTDHSSFHANPSAVSLLHASFMPVMDYKSTAYLPGLKAGGKRRYSGVIYLWGAACFSF